MSIDDVAQDGGPGETPSNDGGEQKANPEVERLAREMGWKPESEWKGDPPKGGFVAADEFINRGERIIPIINGRLKRSEEEKSRLSAELEAVKRDHADNVKRIERMSKVALEQQREQLVSQYEARKEAAVETGDKDAFRQAQRDQNEALKKLDERLAEPKEETEKKTKQPELPRDIQEVVTGWITTNSWYNTDEEMQALANARHMKLLKEKPGLSLSENLKEVRAYVAKRFPEAFNSGTDADDAEPPARRSAVEGGSRLAANGSGKSVWAKVPAADRQIAENAGHLEWFLKPGETMEKNASQARERWATQYFGDER